jgi:3-dehydroquinate synthase
MNMFEREIRVSFKHRVHFTHSIFDAGNPLLETVLSCGATQRPRRILLVMDECLADSRPGMLENIQRYFRTATGLELVRPPLLLPGGEQVKSSWSYVSEVHAQIHDFHLDRQSCLLAVGGGALLDMAGFAAATAHRGVLHVRIPTTTLSQADSGVGVKNGINAFGKKNFIGTFAPPFAVINDFEMLASLTARDKRCGLAEAVKVALIRDKQFFDTIEQQSTSLREFENRTLEGVIVRCAELHIDHIARSGDPFEFGSARPLDFGHWAAHKLEQMSGFKLRHGEAVAIGIAIDVIYSHMIGLLDRQSTGRILSLLEALGFNLFASELTHVTAAGRLVILDGLEEFREHLGGELSVTLLSGIGCGVQSRQMIEPKVIEAIAALRKRSEKIGAYLQ